MKSSFKSFIPLKALFIGFAVVFNWLETCDIQVRWLLNVFKKNIILPSKEDQMVAIMKQKQLVEKDNRIDYNDIAYTVYNYMKELAQDIKNSKAI